jgi:hypothetical protein
VPEAAPHLHPEVWAVESAVWAGTSRVGAAGSKTKNRGYWRYEMEREGAMTLKRERQFV